MSVRMIRRRRQTKSQPDQPLGMTGSAKVVRGALIWSAMFPNVLTGRRTIAAASEGAYNGAPVGAAGLGRRWTRSANAGVSFGSAQAITQQSGVTVLVVAAPTSAAALKVPFSQRIASGAYTQTDFVFNSVDIGLISSPTAGAVMLASYHNAGTGVAATGQLDGKMHCWVAGNGIGNGYIYRDGKKQNLAVNTRIPAVLSAAGQQLRVGNIANDAATTWVHDDPLYLVIVWDRLLHESDAASLSANNRQIERRRRRRVFQRSTGQTALAGNAAAIVAAAGDLSVAVPLAGAAVSTVTAGGPLSTALPLSGVAAAVAAAVGSLNVGIALLGGALAQMSAAGDVSIQFALAGNALARVVATGNLNPGNSNALAGDARAQASAAGGLSVSVPLAGNAQVVAGATGNLGLGIPLQGAAVVVTAAGGNLLVTVSLSGAALAQVIAAGGLAVRVPLLGAAVAQAAASGFLSGGNYVAYTNAPAGSGPVVLALHTNRPPNVGGIPAVRPIHGRRPANAGGRRF